MEFLFFSDPNRTFLMSELSRRRYAVDEAFAAVPDFDITTVAVNTGEVDYSQNNGQVMSKSQLLFALRGTRRKIDRNAITFQQIIRYVHVSKEPRTKITANNTIIRRFSEKIDTIFGQIFPRFRLIRVNYISYNYIVLIRLIRLIT